VGVFVEFLGGGEGTKIECAENIHVLVMSGWVGAGKNEELSVLYKESRV